MEQKPKTYIRPIVIVMLFAFLTIGYAYLTSVLNINGSSLIKTSRWDVHFDNVQVMDGSVTGEQVTQEPTIVNDTTVEFHVNLKKPGDYYEFTVDAVNAGTVDAMLDTNVTFTIPAEYQDFIETIATYADGEEIVEHQQLLSGDTAVFRVKVLFKTDIEPDDLPDNSTQLDLEYTVGFIQRDITAVRRRAENTLYNVLKDEAEGGGLARKYTGSHQDSMDASLSTKDIYHWYAENDTEGTSLFDKNNVIFANHCWNLIRTTDTGGAKLLYNGEVEEGKCLNTRGNHIGYQKGITQSLNTTYYYGTSYEYDKATDQFSLSGTVTTGEIKQRQYTCKATTALGTCSTLYYIESLKSGTTYFVTPLKAGSHYSVFGSVQINREWESGAYLGYMYNKAYHHQTEWLYWGERFFRTYSARTTDWYADSVEWGSPTANKYNLVNPYQISSTDEISSLVGKYTFRMSNQNYTDTRVYYIVGVDGSNIELLQIEDGKTINDYNHSYTYGTSYTDNGDGTYTIKNARTINVLNWYTNYSNIGEGKYVCKDAVNNTCNEVWYNTSMTANYNIIYFNITNPYKFANSFTWDGTKYILDDSNSVGYWNFKDSNGLSVLSDKHYTCFNTSGECTTLSYVYDIYTFNLKGSYINLNNGESIEDALRNMLYDENINVKESTLKIDVEAWYEKYLLDYSDYIEDIIYCNNRNIASLGSWNPNGGAIQSNHILLKEHDGGTTDLSCVNVVDRFSVSNNKAKLKYKVGIITSSDLNLMNNQKSRVFGYSFWLLAPGSFDQYTATQFVTDYGYIGNQMTYTDIGVKPSISLKPGMIYISGDGSMANPYVIDTN